MTTADVQWERWELGAGLTVDRYLAWEHGVAPLPGGANAYQRVAGTGGVVFVRYGPEEDVDAFVASLRDAVTDVTVEQDATATVLGRPGRHLVLSRHRQELGVHRTDDPRYGPTHGVEPAMTEHVEVTAFELEGTPVLVGFRLPAEQWSPHRAVVERIVASLSVAPH